MSVETWAADLRHDSVVVPNLSITFLRHLHDQNIVEFVTSDGQWHAVASDDIVLTEKVA
jgi:hypothetical protein